MMRTIPIGLRGGKHENDVGAGCVILKQMGSTGTSLRKSVWAAAIVVGAALPSLFAGQCSTHDDPSDLGTAAAAGCRRHRCCRRDSDESWASLRSDLTRAGQSHPTS